MFVFSLISISVLGIFHTAVGFPKIPESRFIFSSVSGGGCYPAGSSALLEAVVSDADNEEGNDDWKFCTWTRLKDNAYCKFTYECEGLFCDIGVGDFSIRTECSVQLMNRISYNGEDPNQHNRVCGLLIKQVAAEDTSVWTIEAEECKISGCGSAGGNGFIISSSVNVTVV